MDRAGGRLGLLYQRKPAQPGTLTARLCAAIETALSACRLLEQELLLGGDIKFAGDEFVLLPTIVCWHPITRRRLTPCVMTWRW